MKSWIFSDVHGCYDELMALYNKLPINPEKDKVVFCGDYIDRGPKSKEVVQQLIDWKEKYPHWVVLYGNHEDLMLDALIGKGQVYHSYDLWFNQGGKETLQSYVNKDLSDYEQAISQPLDIIPVEHISFLSNLPRYHEDEKYFYVHGGFKPGVHPKDTDPYELIWIRDEFIDSDYDWGKKVIFGHTAKETLYDGEYVFEPIVKPNKIGIDTAVCGQGKLTCLELPNEVFHFQEKIV